MNPAGHRIHAASYKVVRQLSVDYRARKPPFCKSFFAGNPAMMALYKRLETDCPPAINTGGQHSKVASSPILLPLAKNRKRTSCSDWPAFGLGAFAMSDTLFYVQVPKKLVDFHFGKYEIPLYGPNGDFGSLLPR